MKKINFPLNKRFNYLSLLALVVGTSFLQGCSSFAIGDDEFSCPITEDGVPCASSKQMYDLTNNGQTPKKIAEEKKKEEQSKKENKEQNEQVKKNGESDYVLDNFVTNKLPSDPIPVRTPPTVMRIWVAPYEDKEGDFIMSGYVYTEVSPRRWTLGVNSQDLQNNNSFQPLNKK